jgi:hypothetical protein
MRRKYLAQTWQARQCGGDGKRYALCDTFYLFSKTTFRTGRTKTLVVAHNSWTLFANASQPRAVTRALQRALFFGQITSAIAAHKIFGGGG